jgi:crossover junction endodeoxyribonuclease RusA
MIEGTVAIPGEPVAKQRARVSATGKVYTPNETKAFERAVGLLVRSQLPRFKDTDRLIVNLSFYCSSQAKDLDNLCKSVLDGMQKGGCFKNDSQVMELHASKFVKLPGEASRTEIQVRTLTR